MVNILVAASEPQRLDRQRVLKSGAGTQGQGVSRLEAGLIFGMLLSLFLPIILSAGSIALPIPRLYVAIFLIPAILVWARGGSGTKRVLDYLIVVFSLWGIISMLVVNGVSTLQLTGSMAVETIGAYFLGRWCIQNKDAFLRFVTYQLRFLVILLPFAIMETISGDPFIIQMFAKVFQTQDVVDYEQRLGLHRVQAVFQHPILYGYFASVTFSLVVFGLNFHDASKKRFMRLLVVGVSTFLSLSSGPLAGMVMQILLTVWEKFTRAFKARWKFVFATMFVMYFVVDIISNRTPFHVFVTYLTFNTGTSYFRILIFEFGWQNVMAHPIFGIGVNDWVRPHWMPPSVDNFFLLWAMRHGLPGLFLLLGIFITLMIQLGRRTYADPHIASIRMGVNFSLVGTIIIGTTVHLWGPVYVWLWFFIGGCMWLLEDKTCAIGASAEDGSDPADEPAPTSRYSRFAPQTERKGPAVPEAATPPRPARPVHPSRAPKPRGRTDTGKGDPIG